MTNVKKSHNESLAADTASPDKSKHVDELPAALHEQQNQILALEAKLAHEVLRADQGWERYDSANKDRNALRSAMCDTQLPNFKVSIATLNASNGTSYVVILDNSDRLPGTSIMDSTGRLTPFSHPNLEYAQHIAQEYAKFLNVSAPVTYTCIRCAIPYSTEINKSKHYCDACERDVDRKCGDLIWAWVKSVCRRRLSRSKP